MCVCGWSDLSLVTVAALNLLYPRTEVPISDHHGAEEELCVVKLVLRVSFADRVGIGEGVQVGEQVEPRREVFGRPCCLCKMK